jgi:hypothetical protein
MRNAYKNCFCKKKAECSEHLVIGGRIILKCTLRKEGVEWVYVAQSGTGAGSCEHSTGPLCSIKGVVIID